MSLPQYYIVTLALKIGDLSGSDLVGTMEKLRTLLCSYSTATTCIHKYKVTGEPRVVAVFEVSNVMGLERMVAGIARLGNIDVTCKPLIRYQKFGEFLGVDKDLTSNTENTAKDDKQLYWLDFTVEYPGKSTEELLDTWRNEANAALGARQSNGHLELFKNVAERKVQAFIGMADSDLDALCFNLPVMKENGNGVTVKCHHLLNLDDYCARISSEDL